MIPLWLKFEVNYAAVYTLEIFRLVDAGIVILLQRPCVTFVTS